MKATLEFDLPEEREEHKLALDGGKWMSAIHELDEWMRTTEKHTDIHTMEIGALRKKLYEILEDMGLTFD